MEGGEKRERVGKKSMQMETERKPGVVISEDYRSETSGVVFRSEPKFCNQSRVKQVWFAVYLQ